jgi:hypothetical protein
MSAVPETSPGKPARPPAGDAGRSDLHVVVGAGGAVGRLVVAHLHAAGVRVRAVTRDGSRWRPTPPTPRP